MPESKKKSNSRKHAGESTPQSADTQPCLFVGIGASTGGLKALKAFFSSMPIDTCMAFVVVPHLDPTHQGLMHELLARETRMPVCEAEEGMTVEHSHVYIIPPARYLMISDSALHLIEPQESRGTHTAIDHFLRSLARDQQERTVGIILSGTGSHGSAGLKEIKLAGGMVMVQQPQSAEYDQMPRSAIATGVADYVLPPEQMPEALVKFANHFFLRQPPGAATTSEKLRQLNEELEQRIAERTAELQHSEQEFHALADNVPALFSYLDAGQRYRYVNRRYEERWNRPATEIIGKTAEELLGTEGYSVARPHIEAVLAGEPMTYEAEFEYADAPRSMQVRYVPDIDATGRVQGFFALVNDITELKQAEAEIREREQRLRIILETAPDVIITIGSHGEIIAFNRAAEVTFGYSADEAIGRNVSMLMPSPYREEHDGYLARYLETRESRVFGKRRQVPGRRKDGSTFPLELTVSEIDHRGLFVGIIRDISTQRELEREVINASTLEQERIGRELHDGLGQRLTGLSMMVESLRKTLTKKAMPEAATTETIITQLQEATRETRTIAHGLIPVPLTEQGLTDALNKLAEDTQTATGISCSFTTGASGGVELKDRATAMQLYRIAQELVHNAVRHAQARHITISLSKTGKLLELSVCDDGKGFQPDNGEKEGYGLRIMRYRAAMTGCELTIDSTPGKGTVARCILHN
jgi:two-component system, LuxR family, sensor kinase FixL